MHLERALNEPGPVVGVVMGSSSDWETLQHAAEILAEFGVPHEAPGRLGAPHARRHVRLCRSGAPAAA